MPEKAPLKILDRLVQAIGNTFEASTLAPLHHIAVSLVVWQYSDDVLFAESGRVLPEVLNPERRRYSALVREVYDLISERHSACHMQAS